MPFTRTRLDEDAVKRLVALYKDAASKMMDSFDATTDFGRSQRLALLAQVDKALKELGVKTDEWLRKEIPLAYQSGGQDAIDGLEKVNGHTVFWRGEGKSPGGSLLGSGYYISDSKKVAAQFGKVKPVYLNIFNPNEILRINTQDELESLYKSAARKYPKDPQSTAIAKYAKDQGYKAILGTNNLDPVAGINVLDKKLVSNKPFVSVKTVFTQPNKDQVAALIDDSRKAFGEALTNVGRSVRSITQTAFQREVQARIAEGVVTAETRTQIAAGVKQQLREKGMTALTDRGGKSWSLDRYADMLTRTKLTEARNTALSTKMLENGQDLVQVSINGSNHPACADQEGKIFSLTGKTDGYPPLDDAINEGLFHPNCQHTINPVEPTIAARTFGWDRDSMTYKQGVVEDE